MSDAERSVTEAERILPPARGYWSGHGPPDEPPDFDETAVWQQRVGRARVWGYADGSVIAGMDSRAIHAPALTPQVVATVLGWTGRDAHERGMWLTGKLRR